MEIPSKYSLRNDHNFAIYRTIVAELVLWHSQFAQTRVLTIQYSTTVLTVDKMNAVIT